MKTTKKILTILANTILVILIAIGVFIGVTLLPFKNNFKLLAVTSGSMQPTISVGSLVVIQPASVYGVGDIITFSSENSVARKETTTHRIQAITEKNAEKIYTTKGDANNAVDTQKINEGQIVGKYRFSIALLGYLLGYLKTIPGLILIIVIPATIIIYEEVKKIGREMDEIKKRKKNNKLNKSPKKEKHE